MIHRIAVAVVLSFGIGGPTHHHVWNCHPTPRPYCRAVATYLIEGGVPQPLQFFAGSPVTYRGRIEVRFHRWGDCGWWRFNPFARVCVWH